MIMGWDGRYIGYNPSPKERQQMIDSDYTWSKDDHSVRVVKSTMKGNTYYGVIEVTDKGKKSYRTAVVVLTSYSNGEIAFKSMDESMGPNACDMPVSYLKLLTPTESQYANDWRMKVVENNEIKGRKWEDRRWEIMGGEVDTPTMVALLSDQTGYPQSAIENTRWIKQMKPGQLARVKTTDFKRVFNKKTKKPMPDIPKLAEDLNKYAERSDPYGYRDVYDDATPLSEEAYRQYLYDMSAGHVAPYIKSIETDLREDDYTSDPQRGRMARSLVRRMRTVGAEMGTYNKKPMDVKSILWRKI